MSELTSTGDTRSNSLSTAALAAAVVAVLAFFIGGIFISDAFWPIGMAIAAAAGVAGYLARTRDTRDTRATAALAIGVAVVAFGLGWIVLEAAGVIDD